jgi:hypothetical protein
VFTYSLFILHYSHYTRRYLDLRVSTAGSGIALCMLCTCSVMLGSARHAATHFLMLLSVQLRFVLNMHCYALNMICAALLSALIAACTQHATSHACTQHASSFMLHLTTHVVSVPARGCHSPYLTRCAKDRAHQAKCEQPFAKRVVCDMAQFLQLTTHGKRGVVH